MGKFCSENVNDIRLKICKDPAELLLQSLLIELRMIQILLKAIAGDAFHHNRLFHAKLLLGRKTDAQAKGGLTFPYLFKNTGKPSLPVAVKHSKLPGNGRKHDIAYPKNLFHSYPHFCARFLRMPSLCQVRADTNLAIEKFYFSILSPDLFIQKLFSFIINPGRPFVS